MHNAQQILDILPQNMVDSLINSQDDNGRTPIFWALSAGYSQMAIALLKAGANINHTTTDGESVMDAAYQNIRANREFIALVGNMREN